ncbi:MAG: serine/threonine protein kinase [Cyanobacteria bacterium SZAS TMP-1]|nr:serine/threonine protein kinase [Cyanobacteria bacterium SZAS TMP-1]
MKDRQLTELADLTASANARAMAALNAGSVIDGKYKIVAMIGEGGMGAIYKVDHLLLQKEMALKTFRAPSFTSDSWQRFQREAQTIAKLKHKNIVDVFDCGIADGRIPYYTMELLTGHSLADELKENGPMDTTAALRIFSQIADALAHAHRQNIIHRDIKPANIFLALPSTPDRSKLLPKLVDFGIAKLAESTPDQALQPLLPDQSLTQAGTIFGSPLYMSPEQSMGYETDLRTDIYSFGCALFETLTGKPPFVGDNALQTMILHQTEKAPSLKECVPTRVFPQRLEAAIGTMLAKKPEDRYPNFNLVREELDHCISAPMLTGSYKQMSKQAHRSDYENFANKLMGSSRRLTLALALIIGAVGLTVLILMKCGLINGPSAPEKKVIVDTDAVLVTKDHAVKAMPRPYLAEVRKEATGNKRVFRFPASGTLGTISYEGLKDPVKCVGEVIVPENAKLFFVGGTGLRMNPELLRWFGPNDLWGIQLPLQIEDDWSDQHLAEIGRLTGLRSLDISRTYCVTAKCLKDIDKLKNLNSLGVAHAKINGADLINLKILPQIEYFDLAGLQRKDVFLKSLADHDSRVRALDLNYAPLKTEDMRSIGRLKQLKVLSALNCHISNDGIAALAPAATLESTHMGGNDFKDPAVPYFARYKNLRDLTVSFNRFTPAALARLRRILPPSCQLVDADAPYLQPSLPQQPRK